MVARSEIVCEFEGQIASFYNTPTRSVIKYAKKMLLYHFSVRVVLSS